MPELEDAVSYRVVVNHEEQYSIWEAAREIPAGWRDAGMSGSKQECLDHIDRVWTDMRPLSLRKRMEEAARNPMPAAAVEEAAEPDLVDRLSEGWHPVEASVRVPGSAGSLKQDIDAGYVHVRFPETRGGTVLGFRPDASASDYGQADFAGGAGMVRLAGYLTLDFIKVRCVAQIDLKTLRGQGRLERTAAALSS